MIQLYQTLDLRPIGIPQTLRLSQYDSDFEIIFELTNFDGTWILDTNTTAEVQGTKTDGHGYSADAVFDDQLKTVTIAGDVQMTAAAGRNVFEVVLFHDGDRLGSKNFILDVERAALDAETTASDSKIKNFTEMVEAAEDAAETATAAAEAAEEAAVEIPTIKSEVEDARIGADGTVYLSAGDAVRGQISDIKSDISSRLNFLALEQGGININTGVPIESARYVRTISKIEKPMRIDTGIDGILIGTAYNYSSDGSFDSYSVINAKRTDIVPARGKFVLLTFYKSDNNDISPYDLQPELFATRMEQNAIDTESNSQALIITDNISSSYIVGSGINNSVPAGNEVDTTPVVNSAIAHIIVPCRAGDTFTIIGTGGSTYRLWSFMDTNFKNMSAAPSNAIANGLALTADVNGYFISNVVVAQNYGLSVNHRSKLSDINLRISALESAQSGILKITDPHLLSWKMGAFDANGPQHYSYGMLPKDRMFTIVKVKAGSSVMLNSSYSATKRLSFGYKLSETDTTLTGYTNNAGNKIVIENDCIMYLGVRYSPVLEFQNDTILDELIFDLDVVEYASRYDKSSSNRALGFMNYAAREDTYTSGGLLSYGYPCPDIYYEGQHEDTTGWNNYFTDIDSIHAAFDALATESNGFFSRIRDYGVAYTGNAQNPDYAADHEWHVYEYATKPTFSGGQIKSVPKVAVICCMHANEKMSVYAMHYLIKDLIEKSTYNSALAYLKNNCMITFIPVANPYGFIKTVPSRLNENGVNLNRNFPTYNWEDWEDTRTDGNGSEPGGMNYKGESAGSESETQIMMAFLRNNYDAIIEIDLHTNGADTASRSEISAAMIAQPNLIDDPNYDILHGYLEPAYTHCYRLKPWLNERYNAGLTYANFAGSVVTMPDYPCAAQWIRETIGVVGITYEVMAGSSTGFIGPQLTQYGAATIKAAAEELGNFIVTLIAHCQNAK